MKYYLSIFLLLFTLNSFSQEEVHLLSGIGASTGLNYDTAGEPVLKPSFSLGFRTDFKEVSSSLKPTVKILWNRSSYAQQIENITYGLRVNSLDLFFGGRYDSGNVQLLTFIGTGVQDAVSTDSDRGYGDEINQAFFQVNSQFLYQVGKKVCLGLSACYSPSKLINEYESVDEQGVIVLKDANLEKLRAEASISIKIFNK